VEIPYSPAVDLFHEALKFSGFHPHDMALGRESRTVHVGDELR
jgi:hypothetical protein